MRIILDASSAINLHRSGLLELVMQLTAVGFVFHVGFIVIGECADMREWLDEQASKGLLAVIPDDALTPDEFAAFLSLYELGSGETECIALAKKLDLSVCTDDKAARRAAEEQLGKDRVIGSLRLLRECVCQGLLTPEAACAGYETMRASGAFLPSVAHSYFDC